MFSVGKVVQNEKEWQSGDDTVPFYFGLGEDISFRKGTVSLSLLKSPKSGCVWNITGFLRKIHVRVGDTSVTTSAVF